MIGETSSLLLPPKSSSDSNPVIEATLRKLGENRIALGMTKGILNQLDDKVLKCLFYGIPNLQISPEIAGIENAAEISSKFVAAAMLKYRDAHLSNGSTSYDFLKLMRHLDKCSYDKREFRSLVSKLKNTECFDSGPGKQKERFWFLKKSTGQDFVKSFSSPYKFSDKQNSFACNFYDREDRNIYIDIIYKKFEFLGKEAKKLII